MAAPKQYISIGKQNNLIDHCSIICTTIQLIQWHVWPKQICYRSRKNEFVISVLTWVIKSWSWNFGLGRSSKISKSWSWSCSQSQNNKVFVLSQKTCWHHGKTAYLLRRTEILSRCCDDYHYTYYTNRLTHSCWGNLLNIFSQCSLREILSNYRGKLYSTSSLTTVCYLFYHTSSIFPLRTQNSFDSMLVQLSRPVAIGEFIASSN